MPPRPSLRSLPPPLSRLRARAVRRSNGFRNGRADSASAAPGLCVDPVPIEPPKSHLLASPASVSGTTSSPIPGLDPSDLYLIVIDGVSHPSDGAAGGLSCILLEIIGDIVPAWWKVADGLVMPPVPVSFHGSCGRIGARRGESLFKY